MAEYRDCYAELSDCGVSLAAISVDDIARAAAMKARLALPFPVLSDARRELIVQWGLLNEKEMGGIAFPAVFAIDREMRVSFRSLDKTSKRAAPSEVAAIVKAVAQGNSTRAELELRRVHPGKMFLQAVVNAVRRGAKTPWSRKARPD